MLIHNRLKRARLCVTRLFKKGVLKMETVHSDLQFIYILGGIVSTILTVIITAKHAEMRSERRLVRIETFLMQCCKKLDIPISHLNE